ncbi:MAG: hypothetical protein LBV26_00280 [Bacteroidales bacterium]|jgi:hypothetical protein|nr:hypothetical protein [Bacteroidales bacterium]
MQKGTGILLDEQTGDIEIAVKRVLNGKITGGMVIGDTTAQNQYVLLQAHTGELKHAPATGIGINGMLLDSDSLYWQTRIRQAMEKEGFRIKTLRFTGRNEISIDANY